MLSLFLLFPSFSLNTLLPIIPLILFSTYSHNSMSLNSSSPLIFLYSSSCTFGCETICILSIEIALHQVVTNERYCWHTWYSVLIGDDVCMYVRMYVSSISHLWQLDVLQFHSTENVQNRFASDCTIYFGVHLLKTFIKNIFMYNYI